MKDTVVRILLTVLVTAFFGFITSRLKLLEANSPRQAAAVQLRIMSLIFFLMVLLGILLVAPALIKGQKTQSLGSFLAVYGLLCAWPGFYWFKALKRWRALRPKP